MKENKKTALVIGGTGIMGVPIIAQLLKQGNYAVHSISLDVSDVARLPESVQQYFVDRRSKDYKILISKLNAEVGHWDVVIDLIASHAKDAEESYSLLKDHVGHFITISTTLVYDRSEKSSRAITEENKLAETGDLGGYVDGKLELERFWHFIKDMQWTLLRPYHILGEHSLLGCLPEHNRDPRLIERIKKGETLKLCEGGTIAFNYIHPEDIGIAICKIIGDQKSFGQVYNLVNPELVIAKDYYAEIARQLGVSLSIENISMEKVWSEMKGWEMTTLPHLYSMEKMERDFGYIPSTPLAKGIEDALKYRPYADVPADQIPVHQRMNKLPRPKKMSWL